MMKAKSFREITMNKNALFALTLCCTSGLFACSQPEAIDQAQAEPPTAYTATCDGPTVHDGVLVLTYRFECGDDLDARYAYLSFSAPGMGSSDMRVGMYPTPDWLYFAEVTIRAELVDVVDSGSQTYELFVGLNGGGAIHALCLEEPVSDIRAVVEPVFIQDELGVDQPIVLCRIAGNPVRFVFEPVPTDDPDFHDSRPQRPTQSARN